MAADAKCGNETGIGRPGVPFDEQHVSNGISVSRRLWKRIDRQALAKGIVRSDEVRPRLEAWYSEDRQEHVCERISGIRCSITGPLEGKVGPIDIQLAKGLLEAAQKKYGSKYVCWFLKTWIDRGAAELAVSLPGASGPEKSAGMGAVPGNGRRASNGGKNGKKNGRKKGGKK